MIIVVLDANVLAPGFLGTTSISARLIEAWRLQRFDLVVSEHLLAELSRTFTDPYFRARMGPDQATRILRLLRRRALLTDLTIMVTGVAIQPKDDLVIATALSGGADFIATWDKQLLKLVSHQGVIILHPGDLLDHLRRDVQAPR